MAINIASARTSGTTLFSSLILLLLIASCSSTSLGNVLQPGDKLSAGGVLSTGSYKFTIQDDCNLVLYNNNIVTWESNTANKGTNCSLTLQGNGELFIISGLGNLVWRTEAAGTYGKYTLVLQPNGNVVVYGSPVWSTGTLYQSTTTTSFGAPKKKLFVPGGNQGNRNP